MADKDELILIVDDEPDMCWALTHILKRMRCRTASVEKGQHALRLASEQAFWLAFVDAKLPDMEGIDLAARLRQAQPDLPVVLVSGYFYGDDGEVQKWTKDGTIYGFVSKPFLHDEIRQVVHEVEARESGKGHGSI